MPVYFKFLANDTHVTAKLSALEIAGVTEWQEGDYEFSFHEQHEAGWPVYMIEPGQRGQRNRPKINLKDKESWEAAWLEGNFDKKSAGQEAKAVVVANWELFQKMADKYYEGEEVVKAPIAKRYAQEFKCNSGPCKGRVVTVEVPTNAKDGTAATRLGKCKVCKGKNWTALEVKELKALDKTDAPKVGNNIAT